MAENYEKIDDITTAAIKQIEDAEVTSSYTTDIDLSAVLRKEAPKEKSKLSSKQYKAKKKKRKAARKSRRVNRK